MQLSREIAISDMATFGGFYVDQENMVPGLQGGQVGRRMAGKNVALKSVGLGEQRSALGEITNVTTRRVTAGKSSKQVTRFSFFTFSNRSELFFFCQLKFGDQVKVRSSFLE